jgi:glycosyltransferase involved in cell wall biosynthesis
VHFLGWRRDVPAIVAALDIVVLPTVREFEGTPLAVIEALACGKPVIASDVGAVSEIIRHEDTGLLVPARSEEPLAAAMLRYLGDPEEGRRMGDGGRKLVTALFRPERMVDETEAYFRELQAH